MAEPLVIEVTRGARVESLHRVSAAVCDAAGALVFSHGDTVTPVFPRSAVKVFQAIPFVESGSADAYGFTNRELSLACASHSGEEGHRRLAAEMLERAGLGEPTLECGCHWPFDMSVALDLARTGGAPTPLGNNCSGKHAGFLCTAVHLGEETRGYVEAAHPVQRRALAVMEDLTGSALPPSMCGTDGCSIPTAAAPLAGFARGFAKLAARQGAEPSRLAAGRRLIEACMAEPWLMSGTGRACLTLMEAAPGRVFAKTGAEGVFCGAVPELGLGFALKAQDGTSRAAEAAVAHLLAEMLRESEPALAERYDAMARRTLKNWEGREVGEIRVRRA
ncbi:asparaginase [Aureimonas mangrovi]|uniref:asparaginase n=1 Tax=Aureimonas mangrovi TaxID=2758041 RepID=UPI00163DAFA4|nr:asparaginase [Aureimonas mangrovi]